MKNSYSTRLFATPSVVEGVARLFDFAGNLNVYNDSASEAEADAKALKNDWMAVGADLKSSFDIYEEQYAIKK